MPTVLLAAAKGIGIFYDLDAFYGRFPGLYASGLTITIWAVGESCCILGAQQKCKEKHMNRKYVVKLNAEERVRLHQMLSAGKAAARKLLHARILRHPPMRVQKEQLGPMSRSARHWR